MLQMFLAKFTLKQIVSVLIILFLVVVAVILTVKLTALKYSEDLQKLESEVLQISTERDLLKTHFLVLEQNRKLNEAFVPVEDTLDKILGKEFDEHEKNFVDAFTNFYFDFLRTN